MVAAGRPDQAALGTALAAQIYGGTVLREGVQDRDDNETRFVWLARASEDAARLPPLRGGGGGGGGGEWKTSVVFWGPGAEHAGLARAMPDGVRGRGINLTKIESRPKRERMGRYMFFVDLQGAEQEPLVQEALVGLAGICERVRVLGSYRSVAPSPACATGGRPAVHSNADGHERSTSSTEVRAATRAPAARA